MSTSRERICEAMLDLVAFRGYREVSVEDIVRQAGVRRKDFEALFASKEDCALAVFDEIQEDFGRSYRAAYDREARWPDSMRAATYAAADWLAEHLPEARFALVEMLWVSDLAQARREAAFQPFIESVDAGREVASDPDSVSVFTAERVVGAVAQLVTKRLQHRGLKRYSLVPELMYLAVLPYLGEEEARKELTIPPPERPPRRRAEGGSDNPDPNAVPPRSP